VVGGRLVLLDDEDAGADAADRELLVPFDLPFSTSTSLDLRPGRPVADHSTSVVDGLVGTLGVDEHGVPRPRADPAEHAELVGPLTVR